MSHPPILTIPDFSQPFVLEVDASGTGIGDVLMQQGKPIAFFSKTLGPKAMTTSIYEKEAMAISEALKKWKHYVANSTLIIRTNQKSLKYIHEQRLVAPLSIPEATTTKLPQENPSSHADVLVEEERRKWRRRTEEKGEQHEQKRSTARMKNRPCTTDAAPTHPRCRERPHRAGRGEEPEDDDDKEPAMLPHRVLERGARGRVG
jgi:hypothetical protein